MYLSTVSKNGIFFTFGSQGVKFITNCILANLTAGVFPDRGSEGRRNCLYYGRSKSIHFFVWQVLPAAASISGSIP
jgi:hypothetical protein